MQLDEGGPWGAVCGDGWGVREAMVSSKIKHLPNRVRPRFFDQVGHETMYASHGNKQFFTKSCHRQTYQNYEQPPQTYQNSYFQSHFSVLKIDRIFPKKFFSY